MTLEIAGLSFSRRDMSLRSRSRKRRAMRAFVNQLFPVRDRMPETIFKTTGMLVARMTCPYDPGV